MAQAGTVAANNLPTLYTELSRLGENGDFERALKTANKILQENQDEEKAFHCKIVCFIQLGRFEEALAALKKNPKLLSVLAFEKAYSEYRLNRIEDALKTIRSVEEPDYRLKELYGQVLYRNESYEECYEVYKDLVKNTQDENDDERETNLSAVMAALQLWGDDDVQDLGLREETYEMCYNAATFLIGKGLYDQALKKLQKAEELCRKSFEDDPDASNDDVESELAIILVQMGFVLQKLGQNDNAMKLYNQIVKQKPNDTALMAVASNNIITLNKDQNVFDSKKKVKAATSDGLKQKLTSQQRQTIALNECLLYFYMGQGEQCHRTAQSLQRLHPDCDKPCLIEAVQFSLRERNSDKAVECLQNQISKGQCNSLGLKLALAQLYLGQEHIYNACNVLRSLGDDSFRPGIVSALVALYTSQEDLESAAETLKLAIEWYQTNKPDSPHLMAMIRASANFHLHLGSPQVAAQMLEELRKKDKNDLQVLAKLISAYSKFDPEKAHNVSKQLPSVEKLAKDVDVDSLEASVSSLGVKYVRKMARAEHQSPKMPSGVVKPTSSEAIVTKKRHKKRRKILPKNYDPSATPDTERWLPLRERTYYRGKRKNKKSNIGKGTQGLAPTTSDLDASKSTSPTATSPKPSTGAVPAVPGASSSHGAVPGPRQQKPQAGKQKPKKKKVPTATLR